MGEAKQALNLAVYRDVGEFATYPDGSTGYPTGTDCPMWARVYRLMEDGEEHNPPDVINRNLRGWTHVLDIPTFGVKVLVRYGMDRTLKIFLEDETDGVVKVANYER